MSVYVEMYNLFRAIVEPSGCDPNWKYVEQRTLSGQSHKNNEA